MKELLILIFTFTFLVQVSCLALGNKNKEGRNMIQNQKAVQTAGHDKLGKKGVLKDNFSAVTEKESYAKTVMFPIGEPNSAYAKYL